MIGDVITWSAVCWLTSVIVLLVVLHVWAYDPTDGTDESDKDCQLINW